MIAPSARVSPPLLLVGVVGLSLLMGCSDDSSGADSAEQTTTTLSEEFKAWAAEATEICEEYDARAEEELPRPSETQAVMASLDDLISHYESQLADLKALDQPPDRTDAVQAAYDRLQDEVDAIAALEPLAEENDVEQFAQQLNADVLPVIGQLNVATRQVDIAECGHPETGL